jgi:hypothetical protein
LLQIVALVGTLLVGVVAVSLIVSQTPWFKDWLRRYIVRESQQFIEGDLRIGRLGGQPVLRRAAGRRGARHVWRARGAVDGVEVDYSIFELISRGIVISEITLQRPVIVRMVRDEDGWNLGRLVKAQEREADREGPGRSIALDSIEITDGRVTIDDGQPPTLPAAPSGWTARSPRPSTTSPSTTPSRSITSASARRRRTSRSRHCRARSRSAMTTCISTRSPSASRHSR